MEFDEIVGRILEKNSSLTYDELMQRIKRKQEELKNLITPEGAAIIIAHELNVDLGTQPPQIVPLYIEDLAPGMSRVDVVGRVVRVVGPKDFAKQTGRGGSRGVLWLMDKTASIRMVLWDEKTQLLREKKIEKGDVIRVRNGYVKMGVDGRPELLLGKRGTIEIIGAQDDPRAAEVPPLPAGHMKISEIREGAGEVDVVGRVVSVGSVKTFEREGGEGKVASLIISDGSEWIRVSLWDEWAEFVGQLRTGDAVKIENATVRIGLGNRVELSLGTGGRIIKDHPEALKIPERPREYLKVNELDVKMPSVNFAGRVVRKLPPVDFQRRDGSRGRVMSAILMDETGIIRASFWDSAAATVENVKAGDVVLIENGYTKPGVGNAVEIHAGKNATVKINPPGIDVGPPIEKKVKISEIGPNACGLVVAGRVIEVTPLREFEKEGRKGKVASMVIGDETSQVRVSLWGAVAERVEEIKVGDIVRISRAYSVPGGLGVELAVDEDGKIEVNPSGEEISAIAPQKRAVKRVEIGAINKEGEVVEVRGTIVHVVHKKPIFGACPSCGKSLRNLNGETVCEECGKSVKPQPRCVLTFTLDDGTGTLRVTLFGKLAEKIAGATAEEIAARLEKNPDVVKLYEEINLTGREVVVNGVIRYDGFIEGFEMLGREIRGADPFEETRLLLESIKGGMP